MCREGEERGREGGDRTKGEREGKHVCVREREIGGEWERGVHNHVPNLESLIVWRLSMGMQQKGLCSKGSVLLLI